MTDDGEHSEADSIDLFAKAGLIATSFSANDWLATPVVLFRAPGVPKLRATESIVASRLSQKLSFSFVF